MTLVQLEYIIAVDTYRSFVLAAEKCFVTQPTLSMQIQKLEESLGVRIFDRSKQPVIPTPIGIEILKQARNIIVEAKKIKEIIDSESIEPIAELKIGVIPTIGPYLLPKVVGRFMEKYPRIKLQIWEYDTDKIIRGIKTGMLDCGILSTPLEDKSILERPMFYEPFVAYVSKTSKLNSTKSVVPEDILEEKLWLLTEGHCMRGQVLNICQRKRMIDPEDPLQFNTGSVETLKRMVDENQGTTILPELSILDFPEEQIQHVRYFKSPEPVREISIVTNQNFIKKEAIDLLEKEILNTIPKRFKSKKKKDIMGFI